MSIKTVIVIAIVAALAAAGWFFRDVGPLRGAASSVEAFVKGALPDNNATVVKDKGAKRGEKTDPSKSIRVLRKCVSEARTVYTDEACPPGSREAPISEGNVTVIPSERPAGKADAKDDMKSRQKRVE